MELISVRLGSNSYNIMIGGGLLQDLGANCREVGLGGRAAVVTNPVVAALYADAVIASLAGSGFDPILIEVPDGEMYKTSGTLNGIYDRLIDAAIDRSCFIAALGGGVVGDMAGFAAASYLRGIPFVQIPTTLLAQVDSSVGGKTGIDHPRGKNLIGAFYQPRLVLADVNTIDTLPEREYLAGLAEVVKYGVVLDRELFTMLEGGVPLLVARDKDFLSRVVARCCSIKAFVVEQDEMETGLRAVLNYGHTLGHAFEVLSGYEALLHGEAVSIGMAMAARISEAEQLCTSDERRRICSLLVQLGLPVEPPVFDVAGLASAILLDKKSRAGSVRYICNSGIGAHAVREFTPARLAETCIAGR